MTVKGDTSTDNENKHQDGASLADIINMLYLSRYRAKRKYIIHNNSRGRMSVVLGRKTVEITFLSP